MARTALPVDRDLFEQAVQEVEANGPLATQSALFFAVAEKYNTLDTVNKISAPVAKLRIEGWNIPIKTAKARIFKKSETSVVPNPSPKPVEEVVPKVVSVEKQRRMLASGSCGCGFSNVDTPAGECPAKLVGIDEESVAKWAEKIIAAGHKIQRHYNLAALKYFVRFFYEINSQEWRTVINQLMSITDKPYDTTLEDEELGEDTLDGEDDFSDMDEEPLK